MRLTVFTPTGVAVKAKINKVIIETLNGYYTLLPQHVDFVSAMGANIVSYEEEKQQEKFIACHRGIVVKKGDEVTITVQKAVCGNTLDELKNVIQEDFRQSEEQRKELNTAMARLEIGMIRGFSQLQKEVEHGGI